MKDHEIREAINELRDIALKYHEAQQLRERIARVVLKLCDKYREDKELAGCYDRKEIMTEDGQVDFNKAKHRIVCTPSIIGDIYTIQTKDSDGVWMTLPGIFANFIQADEYYKKRSKLNAIS